MFCLYSPQAGVAALILVVAFGRWRVGGGALGGPRAASKNGGLPSEAAVASSECGTATCAPLSAFGCAGFVTRLLRVYFAFVCNDSMVMIEPLPTD
eukprot:scaffold9761_cov118-Isochrysis_galbana.AAC.4